MKTIIVPLQRSESRASHTQVQSFHAIHGAGVRSHGSDPTTPAHPGIAVNTEGKQRREKSCEGGAKRALLGFSKYKDTNPEGFWKYGSR